MATEKTHPIWGTRAEWLAYHKLSPSADPLVEVGGPAAALDAFHGTGPLPPELGQYTPGVRGYGPGPQKVPSQGTFGPAPLSVLWNYYCGLAGRSWLILKEDKP